MTGHEKDRFPFLGLLWVYVGEGDGDGNGADLLEEQPVRTDASDFLSFEVLQGLDRELGEVAVRPCWSHFEQVGPSFGIGLAEDLQGLSSQIEEEASELLDRIEEMGGIVEAVS